MIKAVLFDMFETQVSIFQSPLYLSRNIASDIGVTENLFKEFWDCMDEDRILGHLSLNEAVEIALRHFGCFSRELVNEIVKRRIDSKQECFNHLNPEIIPLLDKLKHKEIKIGVVSNCFEEEALVIRKSILFPFYDSVCLSCEMGIKKPDYRIFEVCRSSLSIAPDECLYIGDGGCHELEAASSLGMHAVQAMWYVNSYSGHPSKRNEDFSMLEKPLDVLEAMCSYSM